jgi:opacity protein-like surface antigen
MNKLTSATLVCLLAMPVQAAKLNSQTFHFTGRCGFGDMVYSWTNDKQPGAFIYPWLDDPILIRGVEAVIVPSKDWEGALFGAPYFAILAVGNNVDGDIMLAGAGSERFANFFGDDGFRFPARKWPMDYRAYIDLHAHCTPYRNAGVFLTLYYSTGEADAAR